MTREEAIERMEMLRQQYEGALITTQAIDMAIEALEQKPVVRCRDCEYWTKQSKSLQGRCALSGSYPTGAWYCANGERVKE